MNVILQTSAFDTWLKSLRDPKAIARILARIRSAEFGNFGDRKPVGKGIFEMRIDAGPGYRVYYVRRGETTYLLLGGGDKSTQKSDISRAQKLLRILEVEEANNHGTKKTPR